MHPLSEWAGQLGENGLFDLREVLFIGHLGAVGISDVEGVNDFVAEGGDLGRPDVEIAVGQGTGDPVENADAVGSPNLYDGGHRGRVVVEKDPRLGWAGSGGSGPAGVGPHPVRQAGLERQAAAERPLHVGPDP